jgi:hypothetical protein
MNGEGTCVLSRARRGVLMSIKTMTDAHFVVNAAAAHEQGCCRAVSLRRGTAAGEEIAVLMAKLAEAHVPMR